MDRGEAGEGTRQAQEREGNGSLWKSAWGKSEKQRRQKRDEPQRKKERAKRRVSDCRMAKKEKTAGSRRKVPGQKSGVKDVGSPNKSSVIEQGQKGKPQGKETRRGGKGTKAHGRGAMGSTPGRASEG